ncbi:cysteine desulfurase [Nakamurella panacisegetis]|uniref:cysteine desulfurase n=1 Tax=Nakamurella panacisegetis TaxID=1090615 RepID=A0A1H0IUI0_9ACTN|nr:cysteine desulfurase DndA [Nakamurella panacisegetis]SDO34701.1 cysteine desulfurase [Nakamurella panacisegetis]
MTVVSGTDSHGFDDLEIEPGRPIYLDCNATTPVDPRVQAEVLTFMAQEFGNAGSRTHGYGQTAKERVNLARRQVADVVACKPEEVIFTSGATESDNLAILGLAAHGELTAKRHIISSQIEHKAVLEPLEALAKRGWTVTLLAPTPGGWVDPESVRAALRPDTLLVSIMSANNETGVIQPIEQIADVLSNHDAYFHVDGAQGFGKLIGQLRTQRIDLISVSGHKIFAPKGIGALIVRRRGYSRAPLEPLMYGGGQERGLRPGTLPVALIAGLGLASALALEERGRRRAESEAVRHQALAALTPLGIVLNGDGDCLLSSTLNFSVPGVDSEAAIVALKDVVAVSNGSACTSQSYEPSHVLTAAGLEDAQVAGALRFSWSYLTPDVPWTAVADRLARLSQR